MKKLLTKIILGALLVVPFAGAMQAKAIAPPNWDTTGSYTVDFNYLGPNYSHDMVLAQDIAGNLTGNGGSPAGANTYTWVITSGTVEGDNIDFLANYTATPDAVTPQTTMHVLGTVAMGGSMSGTWSDNYQGGSRAGTWTSTSGSASLLGTLNAEDFGVVDYDTGLGFLKGYSAGFGLTNATFTGATSVVVKLYGASDQLLQTNTLNGPNAPLITGAQISSPFDVSGNFNYVTDGYWTNVRETQFGQSVPAVKVIATVTLANGKVVTAENTTLSGDPATIFPVVTPEMSTVHIFKYIDGVQATIVNANNVDFPMFTSTYNAPFTLGPAGWTTGDIAYEASTSPMALGSSYSAEENLSTSLVGTTCDANHTYYLAGYSTGNTLLEAQQATPSLTIPSFTNLQGDKYIIVRNVTCNIVTPPTLGQISGMKYNDLNRNGKKDMKEKGLSGWVIKLKLGDDVIKTATTDASGKYSFTNLAPGTYTIRETHQNGWKRMSKNPKPIVITNSSVVTSVNFGNAQKHKHEKEDTKKDDDRKEQSGNYYGHNEHSNYETDQNNKDHKSR